MENNGIDNITKVCKCCGRELPISEFYKDKTKEDGLNYYCKECISTKAKNKRLSKKSIDNVVCSKDGLKVYSNPSLAKYTPRQLMEELKARGFQWEYMLEPQRKVFYNKI